MKISGGRGASAPPWRNDSLFSQRTSVDSIHPLRAAVPLYAKTEGEVNGIGGHFIREPSLPRHLANIRGLTSIEYLCLENVRGKR